jgi:hypothetical protein
MLKWYWGMAVRNMHCIEESMAGAIYNKADYWGLVGDCKKKESDNAPVPGSKVSDKDYDRVWVYTKCSKFHNMTSMIQTNKLWTALFPRPYDYMGKLVTFETNKSKIDSSLWLVQD